MKKLNRLISMILCVTLLIGLVPIGARATNNSDGTCTLNTGTVYVLVDQETVNFTVPAITQTEGHAQRGQTSQVTVAKLQNNGTYLIVATNNTGKVRALTINGSSVTSKEVTVNAASQTVPVQYISNINGSTIWTAVKVDNPTTGHDAGRQENDWRFRNGNNYLNGTSVGQMESTYQMSIRNNYIMWHYAKQFARMNGNNLASAESSDEYGPPPSNATQFYYYQPTSYDNVYSLSANDVQMNIGDTMSVNDIVRQLKVNGNNLTTSLNGTYSYTIQSGGNVIGLANNTITANATGTATIRVKYSWGTGREQNTVWKDITVNVGIPSYEVDILDGTSSVNVVPIKNVTAQTTKQLNAKVFYGSHTVENATVTWSSTNESVATVDQNGMIHFTGKEGVSVIVVTYTYLDNNNNEVTVTDQVTVTATHDSHVVPSDGTNDFPDYPNEGSVRLDKTAMAVGDFNATGLVEVELSMTGVPFTTDNKLDVVLMLDESNSMRDSGGFRVNATVAATEVFLRNLIYNEDGSFTGNRIYVGTFQGDPEKPNDQRHKFRINDITQNGKDFQVITSDADYNALIANISTVYAAEQNPPYGTAYDESLKFCYDLLNGSKGNGNSQFCVFMTDGIPNVYQGENKRILSSRDMAQMFTGTNYNTRDTDYTYELYSSQMKANGVTVFSVGLGLRNTNSSLEGATDVQCENVSNILLNDISGPAGETAANRDTGSTISKKDQYFFSVADSNAAQSMKNVFDTIAKKIQEAAKDVTVADQITDDYTMVFDAPSPEIAGRINNRDFYIEIVDYVLNPVTQNGTVVDYVRGNGTSVFKLYMGTATINGVDNCYYAASDANGTAFAAPLFESKPIGSVYYWTTNDITQSSTYSGVSVTVGETVYYFDKVGVSEKETTNLTGWYNMSSGAYAYGSPTTLPGTHSDKNAVVYQDLVIATPYFVYDAEQRMLIWTLDKLSSNEIAMRYFLYLDYACTGSNDEPDPGTYPTNVEATLSYTNFQNNKVMQWFPEPQMTWHGAQASYVFYLVNDAGQPVNRAGRVVPFSEAVYVTDVHTISVVWSGLEEQDSLAADILAEELVPAVYQLYDPTATYTIHAFADEDTVRQNNHFKITGKTQTTYVFNTKSDASKYTIHTNSTEDRSTIYSATSRFLCKDYNVTVTTGANGNKQWKYNGKASDQYKENNTPIYGEDDTGPYTIIYKTSNQQVDAGFNFYDTTVAFAVKWIPSLAPDEVVIDYGLDVLIDVTTNDMGVVEPIGLTATAPAGVTINTGRIPNFSQSSVNSTLDFTNEAGTKVATAFLEGGSIRFRLDRDNGMQVMQDFTFYYVSQISYYSNNALIREYLYTSVRVYPATTIYYEENFVDFTNGELYAWETIGYLSNIALQDVDRPGLSEISSSNDADNVYGYDSHYLNSANYSMDATMKTTVSGIDSAEQGKTPPKATFTFFGTGFDIIGRTDSETTSILVSVSQNGQPMEFTGSFLRNGDTITATGDAIFVDTYYQGAGGVSAIKQVPVVTVRDLQPGLYTVTLEVVLNKDEGSSFNHGTSGSFYFDAVRIYNPAGYQMSTTDIGKVYLKDNEWTPKFEEFRNEILKVYGDKPFNDATIVDPSGNEEDLSKYMTFIDGTGNTTDMSLYNIFGPNNELYLPSGYKVCLSVDSTYLKALLSDPDVGAMADMQLGLKLADGSSATVTISSGNKSGQYKINSASDLNFSIKDFYEGRMVISNNGPGLVSVTTMKVTIASASPTALHMQQPAEIIVEEPTENTNSVPVEVPPAPHGIITDIVLTFKQSFAAVVIAAAKAMDAFGKWLQEVAQSLFAGGG